MTARPLPTAGAILFASLTAAAVVGHLGPFLYLPALPDIATEFGASPGGAQATLTVFMIGTCLGLVITGPLADTWGRRAALIVGTGLFALASLACAAAPGLASLIIARIVQGMGSVVGIVVARSAIRGLFAPAEAARKMGVLSASMVMAPTLGPPAGAVVLLWFGWRAGFVLTAVLAVATALPALAAMKRLPREKPVPLAFLATVRRLAGSAMFRRGVALGGLMNSVFFVMMATAPFVFIEELGLSPLVYAACLGAALVGFAGASVWSGRIVGRHGVRKTVFRGLPFMFIGTALVLALTIAQANPLWVFVGIGVAVLGMGFVVPTMHTAMLADFPDIAGSASSLALLAMTLMGVAVVTVYGFLVPQTALSFAMALTLGCILAILISRRL